jgi:hypothetical protein
MKRLLKQWVAVLFLGGAVYGSEPVSVDFFYEPGCRECERIEVEVLPELEARFGDSCAVEWRDLGVESNFLALLKFEADLGFVEDERGYLVVGRQMIFGPHFENEELFAAISNSIGQVEAEADPDEGVSGLAVAEERFSEFTLLAVCGAGLLDGINPCAISTLVFFMSLLAVSTRLRPADATASVGKHGSGGQEVRKASLLALGISYCFASFLAYLALGFGLFRVLHLFAGYLLIRSVFEGVMIAVLLVLAVVSFRDAVRFRKSGDAQDVSLQLSKGMKKRIHAVMRRGLKTRHLLLGGFAVGTLVTVLESVCTGQVYVPTLVVILDHALAGARAWIYLVAYNLFFIVPLVLVFIGVYFGLRTETLLRWSRRNVLVSKILLGLFFVLMAGVIVWA